MVNETVDDQNRLKLKSLEREVEEHLEKWVRDRYHDVLKEEISTDLINWFKLRYSIIAIIVGILAFFGVREWAVYKADQIFESRLDEYTVSIRETELELRKALIKVRTKIDDLEEKSFDIQVSLDQAESQNLLLEERAVQLVAKFAGLEAKAETDAMLIHAATEKMESDIMYVLAINGEI